MTTPESDSDTLFDRLEVAALCGTLLLCALVTFPAWAWLVRRWIDGQYLPGVLALAFIAVRGIQIVRRERLPVFVPPASSARLAAGAALAAAGAMAAWIATVIESSVVLGWCTFVILLGVFFPYAGRGSRSRRLLPLLIYGILVFPPPTVVSTALSLPIRIAAARIAAWLLSACGIPTVARGVVVETLRYTATVVPACGGEEVIHLFLVTGIALAFVQRGGRFGWRFWVQVAAAAPLALIANGVRIAVLGAVGHFKGEAAAAGFFHQVGGLLVFAVFLILMILVGELLDIRRRRQPATPPDGAGPAEADSAEDTARETPSLARPARTVGARMRRTVLLAECVLLLAPAALNTRMEMLRRTTEWGTKIQQIIPADIPGWTWQTLLLTLSEESYLARNYVIKRRYSRDGIHVILFATTGAEGRRQAFHSPEICYVGDGWKIRERRFSLSAPGRPGGRPLRYNLLVAARGERVATTIYWLDDGRNRTADLVVKRLPEILRRLRHPFRPQEHWVLIAVTSLNPDTSAALRECLELARDLP